MAGTPATVALTRARIPFSEHHYDHDPRAASFGREAAEALGLDPAQVFKTLVVDCGGQLAVGIIPVDKHLDLKAIGAALGVKKVSMAEVAHAERTTGYVAGGISPVGQRKALRTVLDASATEHETIYISGGRRGFDIALAPADLVRITRATTAAIATR